MGLLSSLKALYGGDNAIPQAKLALESAKTYAEYQKAAMLLDFLEGRNAWKAESLSPDYDGSLVSARYAQLREARLAEDFDRVLFLLRTTLSRNLGDMGNSKLYSYTHVGTKHRIEEYIAEVRNSFRYLMDAVKIMPQDATQDVLNSLLKTRQSFGRTALLLSGGGTLGMMHVGVVKTLFEDQLLPRVISGSSAGAIVAAVVCTSTDEELPGLVERFPYGNLQVFQSDSDPESAFTRLGRLLKHGVWMDISHLRNVMSEWLGDMTFGEAYNRTRRILNITVSSSSIYEMPRLLNYITSPNVIIWSAIAASCSIPLIFSGSPLLSKDPKTGEPVVWDASSSKCIDGSIEGDLPTSRLSELFNINHFIVSQVNPHVTPFLPRSSHELETSAGMLPTMIVNEVLHVAEVLSALGIAPAFSQRLSGILNQRYIGNITILPYTPPLQGIWNILRNPTPEFLLESTFKGEQATWPRMALIRNHLQIEITLDVSLYQLRLNLVQHHRPTRWLKTSQSQSNLDPSRSFARPRSNSIVSNASIELEPFDVAPTRDPKLRSQPTTPGFEASPFTWDNKSFTSLNNSSASSHQRLPRRSSVDSTLVDNSPVHITLNDHHDFVSSAAPAPGFNDHSSVTHATRDPNSEFARAIDHRLQVYGYHQAATHTSRPQSPVGGIGSGRKSPNKSGTRSPALTRIDTSGHTYSAHQQPVHAISRKVSYEGLTINPRSNSSQDRERRQ